MGTWTFSRKVSASIAAATLIVAIVTSGFVYLTFKHWTERQEVALLDSKLKQFELKMSDVSFLPSLLHPGTGTGNDIRNIFKPDLSAFLSDLDAGQRLEMLDRNGQVLAEVGSEKSGRKKIEYRAEKDLDLPGYDSVKLLLTVDSEHSRSATAERLVGRLLLLGLLIAAGMAIVGGVIVARSTLKPIRRMIGEVRSIRANDLSQRLRLPAAKDELYELGETFNVFLNKLDVSFDQQRRFVADASHELKTPLAIIEGHTHMIQRWGKKSPEVLDESLAFMMNETRRMKELIAQLLLLAESEEPLPIEAVEVCDLKMTLSELLPQTVHVNPEVKLDYDTHPSGAAALIRMPANASYQVLRNIVENALKYTPKGGTVSIRLQEKEGRITVSVTDTGMGISAEQLPHIFDRFYRTESSRNRTQGGSGLGLAITKTIMERYGGSIAIDSTQGQGTTVILQYIQGLSKFTI
ncbi:sensor histidine kinase [Cohnella lupini]|uniref:histidine kinase n=1 Tax=Cohnella lupini TaxID=1294267 RepID=A0A3D9HTW3_9BACL|nr:HAMP domain-containing sensor histidine kinase [Cohnella lupini]RED52954.1 signal transduction histidine kinase [Cohnella lupini]